MTDAREAILKRLKAEQYLVPAPELEAEILHVDPVPDLSEGLLEARFVKEAQDAGVVVVSAANEAEAFSHISDILRDEPLVLGWSAESIPLNGYSEWLASTRVRVSIGPEPRAKTGITGADAALSTTGSLILLSGPGKSRAASLLPDTHIAIVKRDRIVANLESWLAQQRTAGISAIQDASNLVIITGPSRTADIGMELVMGAHGPRNLFVILV